MISRHRRADPPHLWVIDTERDHDLSRTYTVGGPDRKIHTVKICKFPKCSCTASDFQPKCWHHLYVMQRVLKTSDRLSHHDILSQSELRQIFGLPPVVPVSVPKGLRKAVEGEECPICYVVFDETEKEIVWCQRQCGSNVHKECFDEWRNSEIERKRNPATCVMCRQPWDEEKKNDGNALLGGSMGPQNYLNIAEDLGVESNHGTTSPGLFSVRRRHWSG